MFILLLDSGPVIQFLQPDIYGCIAWHAPVASRGEVYGTYLRAVRHAGAFELLGKETCVE